MVMNECFLPLFWNNFYNEKIPFTTRTPDRDSSCPWIPLLLPSIQQTLGNIELREAQFTIADVNVDLTVDI